MSNNYSILSQFWVTLCQIAHRFENAKKIVIFLNRVYIAASNEEFLQFNLTNRILTRGTKKTPACYFEMLYKNSSIENVF